MKSKLKEYLSQLGGYFFLVTLSFLLFFTTSFLVFSFRSRHSQYIEMPNVLGKSYINVHNSLSRLHLKVEIETKSFPDKTDGLILSQSISPGKKVKFNTKVLLLVNQATIPMKVPNLIGHSVENARKILKKVLNQGLYNTIEIGGINYIQTDEKPNIIIKQIPEPGKQINQKQKIYLLVSQEKKLSFNLKKLQNKPYPFVHEILQELNKDFKIQRIKPVYALEKNGLVTSLSEDANGTIHMEVSIKEQSKKIQSGYEKFEYNIEKTGIYKIVLEDVENKKEIFLLNDKHFYKGEQLKMIFYRQGNIVLSLFDSTGLLEKKSYLSEL